MATTITMEIMMKYNSIKEIVTGAHNDTQHRNNARPEKQSYSLWLGAADICMTFALYLSMSGPIVNGICQGRL